MKFRLLLAALTDWFRGWVIRDRLDQDRGRAALADWCRGWVVAKHRFEVFFPSGGPPRAVVMWDPELGTFTDKGLLRIERENLNRILKGDGVCGYQDHPVGYAELKLPDAATDPVQFAVALRVATVTYGPSWTVKPPDEFSDLNFDWMLFHTDPYDPENPPPACLDVRGIDEYFE